MIKINALKIIIESEKGQFGIRETFNDKINFIASYKNTRGKSSVIEAIYYCLGLEELLGGINDHALRPVFRKELEYLDAKLAVIETDFFLEIENSISECVTLRRSANKEGRKPALISVYNGNLIESLEGKALYEDMYVHSPGSATNEKGFHKFLEEFIEWDLPLVPTYEEEERKLYLQTIFSALFIEQKRGWSDVLATIPTKFKIKDVQKRVIEFLINLETLETKKKKQVCKTTEKKLKNLWDENIKYIMSTLFRSNCLIYGLPKNPEILDSNFESKISLIKKLGQQNDMLLAEYIQKCQLELDKLNVQENIAVGETSDQLEIELSYKNEELLTLENELVEANNKVVFEIENLEVLEERLEIIKNDLSNNKDALKIKNLGSTQGWEINKDFCPTCHQKIHDSLLPQNIEYNLMTIEENIKHLVAQKEMLEFTIGNSKTLIEKLKINIATVESQMIANRKIIRSLKADLSSNEQNVSETYIRRKIYLENEIEKFNDLVEDIESKIKELGELSSKWKQLEIKKSQLPEKFTELDIKKLKYFEEIFKNSLSLYGFSSTKPEDVEISKEKYLPTIEGFDMKFDSSASDNIRAIWAFTVSILNISNYFSGNHPNILIFDEPDQQSIEYAHMEKFIKSLITLKPRCQVFIGITLKDEKIVKLIEKMDKKDYKLILFKDKAIQPLKNN